MPAPRPRTSGGFNQGLGNFNDSFGEHLDENAMQSALQQKAQGQQATASAQSTTGGSALGTPDTAGNLGASAPLKPRSLGTIPEELVTRPAQDVVTGLKSIFNISEILGINPVTDDPATQAKKQQMLKRWENLDAEQREVAQQNYKIEMEKKQRAEQEKQALEQQRKQAAARQVTVPSSPRKGAAAQGGKPKAVQQLEDDRKMLGGPQKVG